MKFLITVLIPLSVAFSVLSIKSHGQIIKAYRLQELSGKSYSKFSDSLKKRKDCPKYFENKKTQKEFEKSWLFRNEQMAKALTNNNYVKDEVVLPYIQGIVNDIVSDNKNLIPFNYTVLLDRSIVANATSFGEHIISVNAGIVMSSRSREELALYIAHELSHDILKHSENSNARKSRISYI